MNALRVRVPSKTKDRIAAKISSGLCIIQNCTCEYKSRGLCVAHVNEFQYEVLRIKSTDGQDAAIEYERGRQRDGTVLAPQEQRRYVREVRRETA